MKRFGSVLLLTLASLSAAQDASSGTITVYTALEDDQLQTYLESFSSAYPDIQVDLIRDSTGVITARLLAEKDNPQADVVWGLAASSLLVAEQEGILEPYAPAGLERVREAFRDNANPPTWVGIDEWESAFCVNTFEMEALGLATPTSWADLTKPEYRGQIVMSNPNSSGTGFLSVSALLQLNQEGGVTSYEGELADLAGWDYLSALHDNVAVYTHSGSKPCVMAATGEYPIGISFGYRAIQERENGAPIEAVFPTEGSGWELEANALVKKAEVNPAAKTFLDWAISDDAMANYAQNFALTSVPTDTPVPEGFPEDPQAQLIDNDFNWAAENRGAILALWLERFDSKSEPEE